MYDPHVLAEVRDGIGWLTLNRPDSLNALSFEMTDLLIKHTAAFEKDPAVRCVAAPARPSWRAATSRASTSR